MRQEVEEKIDAIIKAYGQEVVSRKGQEHGGVARTAKSRWVKRLTGQMVDLAWLELGGNANRMEMKAGRHKIPIRPDYVQGLNEGVRRHILASIEEYSCDVRIDKQVLVDGRFVLGMKSSIYVQNAFLKNTLADFHLLKAASPEVNCYLFQLESPPEKSRRERENMMYGSLPAHALMSHVPDVDLRLFTFLERNRKADRSGYNPLKKERVVAAIELLAKDLAKHV